MKRVVKTALAVLIIVTVFGFIVVLNGNASSVDFLRGITGGVLIGVLICGAVSERKACERS